MKRLLRNESELNTFIFMSNEILTDLWDLFLIV